MTRDRSIDCVSGIMIVFMVYRHCVVPGDTIDSSLIGGSILYYPLMFFMAWFFFKGGMFLHQEDLQITIVKGFNRLIIPYIIFSIIAIVFAIILYGCFEGRSAIVRYCSEILPYLKREGAIKFNTPLWFLISLFLSRVFFSLSKQLHLNSLFVVLGSFVFAYFLYKLDLPIGIYFENIALGLLFFSLGFIFKSIQYKDSIFITSIVYYVFFLCYCFITRSVKGDFMVNLQYPYIPTIFYYLSGCIVINNLFKRVTFLQLGLLTKIGANSMIIYVTHFILLSSFLIINNNVWELSGIYLFMLLAGVQLLLMPLIVYLLSSSRIKWIFGEIETSNIVLNNNTAIISTSLLAFTMLVYVILYAIRAL